VRRARGTTLTCLQSSMITAARMLGHKSVNGKYLTRMAVDDAPAFGMQMTHSLGESHCSHRIATMIPDDSTFVDSFITDSANSATAIMSGKKVSSAAAKSTTIDLRIDCRRPSTD
jgi:alkaline phosphatase